jgi:DNA-binding response OmpR family regulator
VENARAAGSDAEDEDRTTVLIVDDNADVRTFVRSILEPRYRVLEAPDGAAGLELATDALPDLVVSDVMMPRLDGFGLSRALKAEAATDCIPVILLTARADTEGEVEGLGTGADDYVTKPFEADVLRARVAGLIASRQHLRERFSRESLPPELDAPARSPFEERLREIIEAHLGDPAFSPDTHADEAVLSYKQLYRKLREEQGQTPSQFIRRVRVERAARLLEGQAGTVSEVAYAVGFNSLSYFNRSFREHFDCAPSAYA